jgi:adenine-specific DNA-methyltransferase
MHAISNIDLRRESIASLTTAARKSELGQFMTPSGIATFMARMFADLKRDEIRILDAGAGIGSLTAAFTQRVVKDPPKSLHCVAWELDPLLKEHLSETLEACSKVAEAAGASFSSEIKEEDFILSASDGVRFGTAPTFTHAILNPPYKKLKSDSDHRRVLRKVGVETSNLYAAFVALSLLMLEDGGELVAITPRSFCNGTYFKPFRKMLLERAALRQVHVFEARDHAFKGDAVLQENIIFHVVKGAEQGEVILSTSEDASFSDFVERRIPFEKVVLPGDDEQILHLPTETESSELDAMMRRFSHTLEDIGIGVSTGPVVDFRLKDHLRQEVEAGCVPLIYCLHFTDGYVRHPKQTKKANAIEENDETAKWLMPSGHYVLVRRLSSKEEKRRIVPALFDPERVACERVGFENHLNVFHEAKKGLSPNLAKGLSLYLGSTFADRWFRRFNGHTQVNAGDLRTMRYPDRSTLEAWGRMVGTTPPSQEDIDRMVEGRD